MVRDAQQWWDELIAAVRPHIYFFAVDLPPSLLSLYVGDMAQPRVNMAAWSIEAVLSCLIAD